MQRFDLIVPQNIENLFVGLLSFNKVIRLKSLLSLQNLPNLLMYSTSLAFLRKQVQKFKPDVILAETSKVGLIASVVAKESHIPCVVDEHGLTFAEAIGLNQKNWQKVMYMEIEALRNSDHILVVSKRMRDYIEQKIQIPQSKMTVVPNGSNQQRVHAVYEVPLKVIYAGGLVYWEKVHDFINIAQQADPKKFRFFLAGDGPLRTPLLEEINRKKVPITYLGPIPKLRIFTFLSKMQIGVAPSTKDLTRQVASPIKVFDYMAAGLPVVTPRIGDWGDLVNNEDCGIALEDDSIKKYLEALDVLTDKSIWNKKSLNAINAIDKKYSWNNSLQPLVNLLQNTEWRLDS